MYLPTLPTLLSLILLRTTLAAHLTLLLPSLPTLPSSTHATLFTHNLTLTAPLRRSNTFAFPDLPSGSYLCEVFCRDYSFAPLRVDVDTHGKVEAWQTFRGNEWDNKGERLGAGEKLVIEVRGATQKGFYESRGGFSPMSLLKNPMILIAVLGMGMMVGLPYLMDNMDPDMKKEFEESQKAGPLAGLTRSANPMTDFDVAGWMAGSGSKSTSSGADKGGGPKARRRG
ncbi:hypothetical protein MMC13_003641 [Lambiella insularis]|nr:hypothetical protein [Lambiella insularis]